MVTTNRPPPILMLLPVSEIAIESDGERDITTWSDFLDSNREMPEIDDIAEDLRTHGRATVGGGASPLVTIYLVNSTPLVSA